MLVVLKLKELGLSAGIIPHPVFMYQNFEKGIKTR